MSEKVVCSSGMQSYFDELNRKNKECYDVAEQARSKGYDPQPRVEIPQAEDLASRVEKLLADWGVENVADDIRKLTKTNNREMASLLIAKEIAKRPAESREKAIDRAIRVGLAVLTEGILVAPLEGLADTKIKTNADGSEYLDLIFAGPIRAAGGTGQAMSVLIADVVRREQKIGKYIPTKEEVQRFHEEIPLYKQAQHLQYMPTANEIELIVNNCPVCIDGEGTEKDVEISGYRDLPRIETNNVRGGACLVIAEGLCQKAAKIKKHVDSLKIDGWDFIGEFLSLKKTDKDDGTIKPSDKYLTDIIAGRPAFGHPSRAGGFRLRYGRGRTTGLAALALNPASMYALDEFPALGTQMKIERPGKACAVTPCDSVEGPILLLRNGNLIQCNTKEEVAAIRAEIAEIVDNGEILVPFGEFAENNHKLVPCGYSTEWHKQELMAKGSVPDDWLSPSYGRAKEMSVALGVPLHPSFNLFWSDVQLEQLKDLRNFVLENGSFSNNELTLPNSKKEKRILEDLGALHNVSGGKIILTKYSMPLIEGLGLSAEGRITERIPFDGNDALDAVSKAMNIEVRARAITRIGCRMGRPEKAEERVMNPAVHSLFPVGKDPGSKREINSAVTVSRATNSKIGSSDTRPTGVQIDVGVRRCTSCNSATIMSCCEKCGGHAIFESIERSSDDNRPYVDIEPIYSRALDRLGLATLPELKCVEGLSSKKKVPEALEKGILRSINGISMFKDGTIRYDMSDVPLTHFRPREIELSVEKAKELGYTHDMFGSELTDGGQLCELKVQDIIPADICGDYMVKVSKFIDDMLEKHYDLERFYHAETRKDLLGHLAIGLAPHTSGGILCRIIGYTKACGGYAHPFFHAAKRRNCDGDEDSIILMLDGLINFSREFLPDRRGGLMDAPLVLTTRLDPNEIDKEAHNIDCLFEYPLDFYKAAMSLKDPKEVEKMMDLVGKRIGSEKQYEGLGFTHDTKDISEGPKRSAYTTLETMVDKMEAQLLLGKKIRAVDENDVATRVIEKHFLPDMAGNLRKFSAQNVRCTKCGEKYRRIPISGKCKCGNSLILTVHEASVKKYLEVSKDLGERYKLSDYTMQRISVLEMSIESLFSNDKVKKCKLSDFF